MVRTLVPPRRSLSFRLRSWVAGVAIMGAVACGDSPPDGRPVAFQVAAGLCAPPALEAYLQVLGVPGICPLDVAADRTVSGRCTVAPTGAITTVRLVYHTVIDGRSYILATVDSEVDLTDDGPQAIELEFPETGLDTDIDADLDGRSNLQEFCDGTDLLTPD